MLAFTRSQYAVVFVLIMTAISFFSEVLESHAQSGINIPPLISAPVVLYDEGNNVIPDGDYQTTVRMINDLTSEVIYEEEHLAEVRKGVAHLVVGLGTAVGTEGKAPAGGLEYRHFLAEGDIAVEIMVEGQENPQLLTHLASQPYSFVSDLALNVPSNSISSIHIKNGSISRDDLAPALLEELTQDQEVVEREVVARQDRQLKTSDIELEDGFVMKNSGGSTLDKVLQGIDRSLDTLRDVHIRQRFNKLRLQNIQGLLEDNQIPAGIARDGEVEEAINDEVQALNIENIPGRLEADRIRGRVAEGNIDNAIARDAELRFENLGGRLDPVNQINGRIPANKLDPDVVTVNEFTFNNIPGSIPENKLPDSDGDGRNDIEELEERLDDLERFVPETNQGGRDERVFFTELTERVFTGTFGNNCAAIPTKIEIDRTCVPNNGNRANLPDLPTMGGSKYFQVVTFSHTDIGGGFQDAAKLFKHDKPYTTHRVYTDMNPDGETCGEVIFYTGFSGQNEGINGGDSYCYVSFQNAAPGVLTIKLDVYKQTYVEIEN